MEGKNSILMEGRNSILIHSQNKCYNGGTYEAHVNTQS